MYPTITSGAVGLSGQGMAALEAVRFSAPAKAELKRRKAKAYSSVVLPLSYRNTPARLATANSNSPSSHHIEAKVEPVAQR